MAECTTIDLLRHGCCEGGYIYRGSSDVLLAAAGWQQMHNSVKEFASLWQAIVYSPLLRCSQFAKELSVEIGIPATEEKNLRETSFGDWEGREIAEVWRKDKQSVSEWLRDPLSHPPPNGEDTGDFLARVLGCFSGLCQQFEGQHIGVISHGGVIRALLSHVVGGGVNSLNCFDVPYASISRIRVWHGLDDDVAGRLQLMFLNPCIDV